MKKIYALIVSTAIAIAIVGCSSWFHTTVAPIVADGIQCAQVEAQAISGGAGTWGVVVDIIETFESAYAATGSIVTAFEALAIQYGEPIVACAAVDYAAKQAAMQTPAGVAKVNDVHALLAKHGLKVIPAPRPTKFPTLK